MIEVELTHKQINLLMPALKIAESAYTDEGHWKAAADVGKIFADLHRQIYTYGQMED